jgi:TfoX/Sxy family transcriptional regulator of competence genes
MAVSDEFLDYVIDQLAVMSYHEIPADVLEDAELLGKWAERALIVARKKKRSS